jgi:hypothetical protein
VEVVRNREVMGGFLSVAERALTPAARRNVDALLLPSRRFDDSIMIHEKHFR